MIPKASHSGAPDAALREAVWRAHGAGPDEAAELLAYAASPLHSGPLPIARYPLPEAPCVAAWERYANEAADVGAAAVLRRVFVQLSFPIRAGMSRDPDYLAATRRGLLPSQNATVLSFARPEGLHILLHPTAVGRVAVVQAEAREDFETLVLALTRRNEAEVVPASMGACMVAGYVNWDRVAQRRRDFADEHPEDWSGEAWAAGFRELQAQKELYQDRFMLLSSGPYSSTPADAIGLPESAWRDASVRLRLEHECTHSFTRHALGSMRKSLLDELVADYMGMVEALGAFSAAHFLRFMGLEAYPRYREGGRLQNYRGSPPLSDAAMAILPAVVKAAAENLERLDPGDAPFDVRERARVILALMRVGLEGLAADDAPRLLAAACAEAAVATAA